MSISMNNHESRLNQIEAKIRDFLDQLSKLGR